MTTIKLDHFITAADTDNIDTYLQHYRDAGFLVAENTVKHEPGLRNGFVRFGPEYLEFCWIEDRELFEQGADADSFPQFRELQAACRPFSIGLQSYDLASLHKEWIERGYSLPEVTQGIPRDAPEGTPPVWSFQDIPANTVGGAALFALTYHTRPKGTVQKISPAPNTAYAISGVTFATDDPEKRATEWRDLLAPSADIQSDGDAPHATYSVQVGPHVAVWMTPEEYQEQYGLSYKASPHPFGELAVIHILAHDLGKAEEMIGAARQVTRLPDKRTGIDTLFVPPDERDGFTLAITQRPVEEWMRERVGVTGERLELE